MLSVKEIMGDKLKVVSPNTCLRDVLAKMNRDGYRHLPVVDDGNLVGIITDRDVRLAVNSPIVSDDADISREAVLDDIRVYECMTSDPKCVSIDTPAREVADLLSLNKFGAMPVLDDEKLVGIISYIDFLKHYAANG
jgi:acetoin utilization protein AcuB